MFSTKRLILRPFIETDLDELLALWNDPAVARTLYHDCPIPRSPKYKDFLKSHAESSFFYLIITSKETGEFMGWTNIGMPDPNNRDGILTIGLLQKFWDRGYGSEVVNWIVDYGFRRLALHRMSLTASEGNARGLKVYERTGFVLEGIKRKANWVEGKWEDIYCMGILASDWMSAHPAAIKP